jgi:acyl carrier protein
MFEELKELILKYVEVDEKDITESSRFIEDLGFNSYMFMCLLGEVEDNYDVEVDEQEVLKLRTVGDAIAYVEKLQSEE